ncbi:response regulator [Larkinella soli]|uniref:response regulator n=1 Tax=Larkinella soli TaxID=1770527 RepID=UPI000FFC2AB9|nr:response regulator [Larkinella soli]
MEENTPIIFIDDDEDDKLMLTPILKEIAPHLPVLFFDNGQQAIEYLRTSQQRPFIIFSEISLHTMSGLELRRQIEEDPSLRMRAIPFIFFTHPVHRDLVEKAYELTIQGFFEKKQTIDEIRAQLRAIVSYWSNCLHPNRFVD